MRPDWAPPLTVIDLAAVRTKDGERVEQDFTRPGPRTIELNDRTFLIPYSARYVRHGYLIDGVYGLEWQHPETGIWKRAAEIEGDGEGQTDDA